MPHDTPLIATIVAGLGLAFVFGTIAQRLKIPPLVGYLLAGVAVGPFTPGYVADQALFGANGSTRILSAWDAHIKNYGPNNGFDYGGRLMAAWIDK